MNAQSETTEKVDQAVDNVSNWWNNPDTQDLLVQRPLKILLIVVIALVLSWLFKRVISRATRHGIESKPLLSRGDTEDSFQARSQEARRQQRMKTLGNVGRSVAAIVIWVWAALAILDQLGVNVAPLIASAGVVGVAIGFGAQSLVKDFFTGMFVLIENQFGVGDTIQVGDVVGEVEQMTLRITTLRDMDGTLWYVRNGDIDLVGNYSDHFSVARLQIPVSLLADPDEVSRMIEHAAAEACKDPEIHDVVMAAPEMLGPSEFNPNYVSFRLTVKTMPGHQWAVARHLNHRILAALRKADVVLAPMDSVLVQQKESNADRS